MRRSLTLRVTHSLSRSRPSTHRIFPLTCQRAIEALLFNYYIDEEDYIVGKQTDRPIPRGFLSSVQKDNQAPIELGVFQNRSMPEVSAILFSSCATWGKIRALSQDP